MYLESVLGNTMTPNGFNTGLVMRETAKIAQFFASAPLRAVLRHVYAFNFFTLAFINRVCFGSFGVGPVSQSRRTEKFCFLTRPQVLSKSSVYTYMRLVKGRERSQKVKGSVPEWGGTCQG